MSDNFVYVEDIVAEKFGQICPQFDVCNGNPYVFTLMRPQFCTTFIYDEINGPVINDTTFNQICEDLIRKAKIENVDVLITPEYCIPLDLIDKMISDPSKSLIPELGKIWCLCCQGTKYEDFIQYLSKFEELGTKVISFSFDNAIKNKFVNALIYIFLLTDGSLCVLPQLKTQIMGDRDLLCEGIGMSIGKVIYKFGKNSLNQLCTIICADSLNFRYISLNNINEGNENVILLHPQLNDKPRDNTFCSLKYSLYSNTECDNMIYITVNWACGTKLIHKNNIRIEKILENSWTCIYLKDTNNNWLEQQKSLRKDNFSKGLGFGYFNRYKLKVWYCIKNEITHSITIRKPKRNGPSVTQPHHDVLVNKVYIRQGNALIEEDKEITNNDNLKNLLNVSIEDQDYNYPLIAEKEAKDKFFGICLGDLEKGQLSIGDSEICNIVSINIDGECEKHRSELINNFNILVDILKTDILPPYMKELVKSHRFSLCDDFYNLVCKDSSIKTKAVVSYIPNESDARKISNYIKEEIERHEASNFRNLISKLISQGKENEISKYISEQRICVFTQKTGTARQIVSYPKYNYGITSSDRMEDDTLISR